MIFPPPPFFFLFLDKMQKSKGKKGKKVMRRRRQTFRRGRPLQATISHPSHLLASNYWREKTRGKKYQENILRAGKGGQKRQDKSIRVKITHPFLAGGEEIQFLPGVFFFSPPHLLFRLVRPWPDYVALATWASPPPLNPFPRLAASMIY